MRSASLIVAVTVSLSLAASASAAEVKAKFLGDGTYAMKDGGCEKLNRIAAGGPKNVETTPETLTADGFSGWEGGCSFLSIKEVKKGVKWVVRMSCSEGAEEDQRETDTFEKQPDGSFHVTNEDKTTHFVRCEVGKGK
jgi:hypothetical protein